MVTSKHMIFYITKIIGCKELGKNLKLVLKDILRNTALGYFLPKTISSIERNPPLV